jgi:hypothetical protein
VSAAAGMVTRPRGVVDLARALADWRQIEADLWGAARALADAIEAESDALAAYAQAVAAGAPDAEVVQARVTLARVLATKSEAARRLGISGRPPVVVRAGQQLLDAARRVGPSGEVAR